MRFRHQGKRRSPGDGGANSGLLGSFGGTNDGEGKSHQVYQLIIADRFYNPGQVSRRRGSVSRNVGFGSVADFAGLIALEGA